MTEMVEGQPKTKATGAVTQSPKTGTGQPGNRVALFLHALAFVVGFGAVFTLIGSAAGLLGQSLNRYLPILQHFGAVLLVLFALVTLGVFRWLVQQIQQRADMQNNPAAIALVGILEFFNTLLYTERRVTEMHTVNRGWGYLSSALLGMSFSAGWLPCIGPILSSIFFLAGNSATASHGASLLAVYSLGLGIPFLITGAAFTSVTRFLRRINRYANIVSIVSGIFLLYVAYLLWSDSLALLTTRFLFLNEWVFALEDRVAIASGTGGDIIDLNFLAAAPLAFIAGVISFISPCVLPLVPAYLGYLSGAALSGGNK